MSMPKPQTQPQTANQQLASQLLRLLADKPLEPAIAIDRESIKHVGNTIASLDMQLTQALKQLNGCMAALAHFGLNLQGEEMISFEKYEAEVVAMSGVANDTASQHQDDTPAKAAASGAVSALDFVLGSLSTLKPETGPMPASAMAEHIEKCAAKSQAYINLVEIEPDAEATTVAHWQSLVDTMQDVLTLAHKVQPAP
jgi:hypothetical protein